MNKKGLVGKIILIIILLIIAIIGFTVWQAYSLVKTVMSEGAVITTDLASITSKGVLINETDCEKVQNIEESVAKIKSKVQGACMNPIIKIAVDKMPQVAIKCKDIPALETQMTQGIAPIKNICANETLMNKLQIVSNSSVA